MPQPNIEELYQEWLQSRANGNAQNLLRLTQGDRQLATALKEFILQRHPKAKIKKHSNSPVGNQSVSQLEPETVSHPDVSGRVANDTTEVKSFGEYQVIRIIGYGGMGTVYLAEDTKLNRYVALKILREELIPIAGMKERFLKEARTAASLVHDHIIPIHQVGEDRGIPFFAMPYLRGETLEDRIRKWAGKPMPIPDLIRIGREIAEGMSAAHELGMIHRDIKPANVWLESSNDRVKLLDFGLARRTTDLEHLTREGMIVGTPAYMAPEQANGESLDLRSDLFSLGCVMYQMATGQRPFPGSDPISILYSIANEEPKFPHEIHSEIPIEVSELIMQLLAKDPNRRPLSALEVIRRLRVNDLPTVPLAIPMEDRGNDWNTDDPWEDIELPDDTEIIPSPREDRLAKSSESTIGTKDLSKSKKWLFVGFALVVFLVGGGFLVSTMIRTMSSKGTLILESDDPSMEIVLRQNGTIVKKTRNRELELNVGEYSLELAENKEGVKLETNQITLSRNETRIVRITKEKLPVIKEKDFKPKSTKSIDRELAEWVISLGGEVQTDQGGKYDRVAKLPNGNWTLTQILIKDGERFTDAMLERFQHLKDLTHFDLQGSQITNAGLACLKDFPKLSSLRLTDAQVTDEGLIHFREVKHLTFLDISGNGIVGKGFLHLQKLPLTFLDLSATKIDDESLKALKPLTNLETIILDESEITDQGIEILSSMPSLANMSLKKVPITDSCVKSFQKMRKLHTLELQSTSLTDQGFQDFKSLKQLKDLDLGFTRITNQGLQGLIDLTNLENLSLRETPITDADFELLKGLKNLEELNLVGMKITGEGLRYLKSLKELRSINLAASSVTDPGLTSLAELKTLEELNLSSTGITDQSIDLLAKLKKLHTLVLTRTKISKEGIGKLRKSMPGCKINASNPDP